MRDIEGMSFREIAKAIYRDKGSVVSKYSDINRATNVSDNGLMNGTMKPRWWKR